MKTKRPMNGWLVTSLLLALCVFLFLPGEAAAQGEGTEQSEVVVGVQGASVDANQDRDAKFELNREIAVGFVLNWFDWVQSFSGGKSYLQVRSQDALQNDQQLNFRAVLAGKLRIRADWNRSPHRYGDGAVFIPGMVTNSRYTVPDFTQQKLEDPDGDGVPFYADPSGVGHDNALAANLMNQLIDSQNTFSLASQRDLGRVALVFTPTPSWTVDFDFSRQWRDGSRPNGSGTYQRITSGYDYLFSVRGQEIPATIDYVTTQTNVTAGWANGRWFGEGGFQFSAFENSIPGITYDSPYWNTDTLGNSGIKRGLWSTGRASMPASSDFWNVFLTGGVALEHNTQITATFQRGTVTQNESFLPVTTNTALIGTVDINGDGVINAQDDPTITSTLPRSSLDGKVSTTLFGLVVSSRPTKALKLTGRFRSYNYDSTRDSFNMGYRAEYLESRLKPDFHAASLLYVPQDYRRDTLSLEGVIRATRGVKVGLKYNWINFARDQYVDNDNGPVFQRDSGTRAVTGTVENRIAASLILGTADWVSGQLTYQYSSRNYDDTYVPGFSGENQAIRQFDIADRKRNSFILDLDFLPGAIVGFGLEARYVSDDYDESAYGLQKGKENGFLVDINTNAVRDVNIYAYAEWSQYAANYHLRTKCKNCPPPIGATWSAPWEVPNFDWFPDYTDTTISFGGGVTYEPETSPYEFELLLNYVQGTIEQLNSNPGPPLNLLGGGIAEVALAHDFPDQVPSTIALELQLARQINDMFKVGLWYLYEDFGLSDFMWDPMNPYGRNYLDVDDATRYLFLDARYSDYSAHVVQGYVSLTF